VPRSLEAFASHDAVGSNWADRLLRLRTYVPDNKREALMPSGWLEAWADATSASDPVGALKDPQVIRAPNGVLQDISEFHGAGKPYYDPAKIGIPTLLVSRMGSRHTSLCGTNAFPLLINSPGKRLVELAKGTHHIMLEKNRKELFETVPYFLDAGNHVLDGQDGNTQ
jgi:pimeloyl-ACP methyl ester carboxylesterase